MSRANAYLAPGPIKSDLYDEKAVIGPKIDALTGYRKTLAFENLTVKQRNLVDAQLSAMQLYHLLLHCRLDEWEDDL